MLRRAVLAAWFTIALAGAAAAQTAPPAPRVTLETTMGAITITLDPVGAPLTSAHMLRLFRTQFYVGKAIFRVEPGYLIQLGDLDADLVAHRAPGDLVRLETATNHHARGAVALAHDDGNPNTGKSSFYVDLAANRHLNADPHAPPNTTGFAVFGHVTAGMDVLDRIARVPLDPAKGPFPGKLPKTPIVVTRVTVQ
jgi:cyclophilin family peptidyl-prolyl cis-trans isomerase